MWLDTSVGLLFDLCGSFSRMRSEGFSFNSGGLGVEACSRPIVSAFATVVNRPQVFAVGR